MKLSLSIVAASAAAALSIDQASSHGMMENPPTWQSSGGKYSLFNSGNSYDGDICYWFNNNTVIPEGLIGSLPLSVSSGYLPLNTTLRGMVGRFLTAYQGLIPNATHVESVNFTIHNLLLPMLEESKVATLEGIDLTNVSVEDIIIPIEVRERGE